MDNNRKLGMISCPAEALPKVKKLSPPTLMGHKAFDSHENLSPIPNSF